MELAFGEKEEEAAGTSECHSMDSPPGLIKTQGSLELKRKLKLIETFSLDL